MSEDTTRGGGADHLESTVKNELLGKRSRFGHVVQRTRLGKFSLVEALVEPRPEPLHRCCDVRTPSRADQEDSPSLKSAEAA